MSKIAVGGLVPHRFAAVDVEIASRSPLRICSIGSVRIEGGLEVDSFSSFVHVDGPIRFTRIHGLSAHDLVGAPPWPLVWQRFLRYLNGCSRFVAFRAHFDRAALLAAAAQHGIHLPPIHFECAADAARRCLGSTGSLEELLAKTAIPFPGRPHDALSDARAAALLYLRCVDGGAEASQ